MRSASISPSISATPSKRHYGQRDHVPTSCSGCATSRCWAAKQAQVFTNTKARSRCLTRRWWNGGTGCMVSPRERRIFHRSTRPTVTVTAEELTHRLIFLMVNEAARCVEEGVVGFSRGCGLRNDSGNGFCTVSRRAVAVCGILRIKKDSSSSWNGWPEPKRNFRHAKF